MLKNVQKNQEIKIGCMPVLAPYHFANGGGFQERIFRYQTCDR